MTLGFGTTNLGLTVTFGAALVQVTIGAGAGAAAVARCVCQYPTPSTATVINKAAATNSFSSMLNCRPFISCSLLAYFSQYKLPGLCASDLPLHHHGSD